MFFFFFKQKTAYEILTCDWSSDVCSSDLYSIMLLQMALSSLLYLTLYLPHVYRNVLGVFHIFYVSILCLNQLNTFDEIGRASCRERV